MRFINISFCILILSTHILLANSVRALWVVRYTLHDDRESANLITTAEDLHITDLYIQVRALGKFFNTDNSNFTQSKKNNSLQNFINILGQARQKDIRVHAWMNIFFVHGRDFDADEKSSLLNSQEKYILRTAIQDTVPSRLALKEAAIEGIYIDPLSPRNYTSVINQINYLTDTLGVAGIHLDYFRYPDYRHSFSPHGRAEFILKEYIDPVDMFETNSKLDYNLRPHLNEKYKSYLSNNLTEFLSGIRQLLNSKHDKTILSIAVKPDADEAKNRYLQNWQDWLAKDLCDQIVLMNYSALDSVFTRNIYKIENKKQAEKIIVGVATYNQAIDPIIRRLMWLGQKPFAGFALFSYNDIKSKPNLISRLQYLFQ